MKLKEGKQIVPWVDVFPPGAEQRFREIVILGEIARQNCAATAPKASPGYLAYMERVSHIRQWLAPFRWEAVSRANFELAVSPCGRYAVATRGGSAAVGQPDQHPRLARTGKCTKNATLDNNLQLLMFPDWEQAQRERMQREHGLQEEKKRKRAKRAIQAPEVQLTYLLLVHLDRRAQEVRAEVSLPIKLDDEEQVTEWIDRCILPPIPLDDIPPVGENDNSAEEEAVDVDIQLLP